MPEQQVRTARSFCRICTSLCGILVDTVDEQVVRVRGDRDHPMSQGYTCVKGRALPAMHHHPQRIERPLMRAGGSLQPAAPSPTSPTAVMLRPDTSCPRSGSRITFKRSAAGGLLRRSSWPSWRRSETRRRCASCRGGRSGTSRPRTRQRQRAHEPPAGRPADGDGTLLGSAGERAPGGRDVSGSEAAVDMRYGVCVPNLGEFADPRPIPAARAAALSALIQAWPRSGEGRPSNGFPGRPSRRTARR